MDGHRVAALADALPDADVVITATGLVDAVGRRGARRCSRTASLLANAGHHDREIDVPALAGAADEIVDARENVKTYVLGGRRVHVLVDGALVNIAGLDGNPIEIMDLSFSVQALSLHHLAAGGVARRAEPLPRRARRPDRAHEARDARHRARHAHRRRSGVPRVAGVPQVPPMTRREPRPVAVIGAGLDLGAGRRGVDMGPSAIRYAGLEARLAALGREVADWGDVALAVPEATEEGDATRATSAPIMQVCEQVAALVDDAARAGQLPLVLGGDHSIAMGTLGGHGEGARRRRRALDRRARRPQPAGTSPTGNVHGMPLAAALGAGGDAFATAPYPTPSVDRAALVGVRSLDPGERALIRELGVRVFTMNEIDRARRRARACARRSTYLRGAAFVHVSLDLDAVDPMFAPGVGTPVRGGLSYREAHLALELVAESGLLDSLDVVEVNPILDRENETGKLAVELVASALGARIL